jgi:hypothetical protein
MERRYGGYRVTIIKPPPKHSGFGNYAWADHFEARCVILQELLRKAGIALAVAHVFTEPPTEIDVYVQSLFRAMHEYTSTYTKET